MGRKKKSISVSSSSGAGSSRASELIQALKKNKDLSKYLIDEGSEVPEYLNTNVISLNLVFSGKIRGGIKKGAITTMAADSQLGKSLIGYNILQCAYREGMTCVVIDTEHSINYTLLESLGIDVKEVGIFQTSKINEIKQIFAIINKDLNREDRRNIFVLLDSWGPIVENQVLEKAEEASTAVNMGSAKFKNELANIINSYGNTTFVINHVYTSLNPYGEKFNIPGGMRLFFNSDSIGLASSAAKYKDKDGTILGKVVTVGVKKGRGAKEFVKTQYLIRHDGGLDPFFGLLDEALESGVVLKSKPGQYFRPSIDVDEAGELIREWKERDLYDKKFWIPIYRDPAFVEFCEKKFSFIDTVPISSYTDVLNLMDSNEDFSGGPESDPEPQDDEEESFEEE